MPSKDHFGDQFGLSAREQKEMAGRAIGEHLLDSVAQMEGFHDWEHQSTARRNQQDLQFIDKYQSQNPLHGKGSQVRVDPDYDDYVYEIQHPSGWKGVHRGMIMEFHHPKHGAVDLYDYSDYTRHGLGSPPTHEDWPEPAKLHQDLNEFVQNSGSAYDD